MRRLLQLENALPFTIIATLALLNGPMTGQILYRAITKEIRKRERVGIKAKAKKELQEAVFRATLARLKKQGLLETPSRGVWQATKKALGMHNAEKEKTAVYKKFIAENSTKRNTIIIFDVPEKKYKIRNYLRAELILLGYELLQKSVWIGGGPLPQEFIMYLKEKDLLSSVHIFTIQKTGTI